MKNFKSLFTTVLLFSVFSSAFAQWDSYLYWDQFVFERNGFTSTETVFSDISDSGIVVGYYRDRDNSFTGLVYFRNAEVDTFKFPGYTNTEILGINKKGEILGRAYTSPSTAIAFKAKVKNRKVTDASKIDWYSSGSLNSRPMKLNDNGIGSGNVQSSTQRWLNYQKVFGGTATDKTTRYKKGSTFYNTYGQGINEDLEAVGYYLDGSERIPFVYSTVDDKFYPVNHRVDFGIPRTFLWDINQGNEVAVEYRDSSGFMRGTLGLYNEGTHSITYYDSFPLDGDRGSSIQGVNNQGDIAGYWVESDGTKVAFFATKKGFQIEGFNLSQHAIPYVNGANIFESDTGDYDYVNGDPYFKDTIPFLKSITDHIPLDSNQEKSIRSGRRSPSWPSYVLAKGADKCYVGGQLRVIQAIKWMALSGDSFAGYCNGISMMTAQHFGDTQTVYKRFPFIQKSNSLSGYNFTNRTFDLRFKESLGALQLYYNSAHFKSIRENWSKQIDLFYDYKDEENISNMLKYVREFSHDFYDTSAVDSLNVMYIYLTYSSPSRAGAHAVFPYKVHRSMNSRNQVDTVFVMEPNYPQEPIRLAFDKNKKTGRAYNSKGMLIYKVLTMCIGGNMAEINISERARLRNKDVGKDNSSHKKSSTESATIHTFGLCDYEIENLDNPGESIKKEGDSLENTFTDLLPDLMFNSDAYPDVYTASQPVNIKSTISGCSDAHTWYYSHKNGDFIYSRSGVKPLEQDVIYNNGATMRVVNEESNSKEVRLTSLYEKDDEEAVVTIDKFELAESKEISMDAMDIYRVKVNNTDGEDSKYDLKVRYISGGEHFSWRTRGIGIGEKDIHTILLKPTDDGKEVRILVDSTGDGNADDTLTIENTLSLQDLDVEDYEVRIYPNPANKRIQISATNLTSDQSEIRLFDVSGNQVKVTTIQHGFNLKTSVDVSDIAQGIYVLELTTEKGKVQVRKRISVER